MVENWLSKLPKFKNSNSIRAYDYIEFVFKGKKADITLLKIKFILNQKKRETLANAIKNNLQNMIEGNKTKWLAEIGEILQEDPEHRTARDIQLTLEGKTIQNLEQDLPQEGEEEEEAEGEEKEIQNNKTHQNKSRLDETIKKFEGLAEKHKKRHRYDLAFECYENIIKLQKDNRSAYTSALEQLDNMAAAAESIEFCETHCAFVAEETSTVQDIFLGAQALCLELFEKTIEIPIKHGHPLPAGSKKKSTYKEKISLWNAWKHKEKSHHQHAEYYLRHQSEPIFKLGHALALFNALSVARVYLETLLQKLKDSEEIKAQKMKISLLYQLGKTYMKLGLREKPVNSRLLGRAIESYENATAGYKHLKAIQNSASTPLNPIKIRSIRMTFPPNDQLNEDSKIYDFSLIPSHRKKRVLGKKRSRSRPGSARDTVQVCGIQIEHQEQQIENWAISTQQKTTAYSQKTRKKKQKKKIQPQIRSASRGGLLQKSVLSLQYPHEMGVFNPKRGIYYEIVCTS